MVHFPSQADYDSALRQIVRRGRLYHLEKVMLAYLFYEIT